MIRYYTLPLLRQLDHQAPENSAPGVAVVCCRRPVALALVPVHGTLSFAAHKPNRLSVPVFHQVKRHTCGETQGQRGTELEETVAKIGGEEVLQDKCQNGPSQHDHSSKRTSGPNRICLRCFATEKKDLRSAAVDRFWTLTILFSRFLFELREKTDLREETEESEELEDVEISESAMSSTRARCS